MKFLIALLLMMGPVHANTSLKSCLELCNCLTSVEEKGLMADQVSEPIKTIEAPQKILEKIKAIVTSSGGTLTKETPQLLSFDVKLGLLTKGKANFSISNKLVHFRIQSSGCSFYHSHPQSWLEKIKFRYYQNDY